jgi:hypothetical protein
MDIPTVRAIFKTEGGTVLDERGAARLLCRPLEAGRRKSYWTFLISFPQAPNNGGVGKFTRIILP